MTISTSCVTVFFLKQILTVAEMMAELLLE
jgi:hypothetical protein